VKFQFTQNKQRQQVSFGTIFPLSKRGHNLSSWYALLPSTEMPGLSPRWGKHLF